MTQDKTTQSSDLYAGGNELYFSFLGTLLEVSDKGDPTSAELVDNALRQWGASWARAAGLRGSRDWDLDALSKALIALGLLRVFAPARLGEQASEVKVMVLRCRLSRAVMVPRIARGLPYRCLLAPIIEGALGAVGSASRVSTDRRGMLRNDECILLINPGGG
jgi:hypothetical protein